MQPRIAVIGAGPAGFYAAGQLLAANFAVDLLDRLPTPYGLVRAGVAPDHPKIKSVTRVYDRIASTGLRYFGGVELGRQESRDELLNRYAAVVYAVRAATDNHLGIPGEALRGSHAATEFVAWYNGHPDFADHTFDLAHDRAVVIGHGNVAVDVARMLVLEADELAATDVADHALAQLGESRVQEVVVLGRRGPAQTAFTTPELRELGELSAADAVVGEDDLTLDPLSAEWLEREGDATAKRNLELLREFAARPDGSKRGRVVLRFLRSPVEVLGDARGRVRGLRVARNRIEASPDGRLHAVPTGDEEVVECGLVIRAVGYRGEPVPDVPFDALRGLIPNDDGRVIGQDGAPLPGEYAAGWIKRGSIGVIGTNKKCAVGTVAHIVTDAEAGRLRASTADAEEIAGWLRERAPDIVTWEGWMSIADHERRGGAAAGRPRVKLVRVDDMTRIAGRRAPAAR